MPVRARFLFFYFTADDIKFIANPQKVDATMV